MASIRRIKHVSKSIPTIEGAGVHLRRAFGFQESPSLDPFLLMDDFHSKNPEDYLAGFPWHPHRGIETITYMLNGEVDHGDSMGNSGTIHPGDVQWMTAGSGIIHQEMPRSKEADKHMWGFQLWANLPRSHKMMEPRYRGIVRADIPEVALDSGARVKVVSGSFQGTRGPVTDIMTDPEYLDVSIPPKTEFRHDIPRGYTAFAYTIDGAAYFDDTRDAFGFDMRGPGWWSTERECKIGNESLVIFDDGDLVNITTDTAPSRFLLIAGKPIKEPVAWYGPIVMNTQEELRIAFEEYRNGTFIKHKKVV